MSSNKQLWWLAVFWAVAFIILTTSHHVKAGNVHSLRKDSDGKLVISVRDGSSQPMQGPIEAGSWTPTINLASGCTLDGSNDHFYLRVGNIVTISGNIQWNCSTTGSKSTSMTLPIEIGRAHV